MTTRKKPSRGVVTNDKNVLAEAMRLVDGHRQEAYGTPQENWTAIAMVWTIMLGFEITAEQAGNMMIALKVVRQAHKSSRDNLVDIAGYARVIQLIQDPAA
jgi:hypothetical protein